MSVWTLEGDYADAMATIDSVKALHKPVFVGRSARCVECEWQEVGGTEMRPWPCDTAQLVYSKSEIERTTT